MALERQEDFANLDQWKTEKKIPWLHVKKHLSATDANKCAVDWWSIVHKRTGSEDLVFPIKIWWRSLDPGDIGQESAAEELKNRLYYYWLAFWSNISLKKYPIGTLSRLENVKQKLKLISESVVADKYNSSTEEDVQRDIEIGLQLLQEFELMLTVPYQTHGLEWLLACSYSCICETYPSPGRAFTIIEIMRMAGVPWDILAQNYFTQRRTAILCLADDKRPATEKRRELCAAAQKITKGFGALLDSLNGKINANDNLQFQAAVIVLNCITAMGQFAWGDYVSPQWSTTTPLPEWQGQIKDLHGNLPAA